MAEKLSGRSKFSEMYIFRIFSRLHSVLSFQKTAKELLLIVELYRSRPFISKGIKPDAHASRRIVYLLFSICLILRMSSDTEIFSSVIECVTVGMVALVLISMLKAKNFSMHKDGYLFAITDVHAQGIEIPTICEHGAPFVRRNPFVVFDTDNSYLVFGQRYFAIGLFVGGHALSNQGVGFVRC